MNSDKKVLILSDGKMGHQNQSVRLVQSLGVKNFDILKLDRRLCGKVLSFISSKLIVKNLKELNCVFKKGEYDIVIGIGSVPRLAMVSLKKQNPNLKTICIMDPKRNYSSYDVIALPTHDNVSYSGDNIVRFTGSLSYFNANDLNIAKEEFKDEFSNIISNPLIGLVIGGDSKGYKFNMLKAHDLLDKTFILANKLGSHIYATTSRRTPQVAVDYIKYRLEKSDNTIYTSGDKNPYRAIMAYSSIIIVTPETVSMLMESCATDALVLISDRHSVKSSRIQFFIKELMDKGLLFDLDDMLNEDDISSYILKAKESTSFDELEKVVEFIKLKKIV